MRWLIFFLLLPLVSAAPCGLIQSDTVLSSDLYCPEGIQLADGVSLNCGGHDIVGDAALTGIRTSNNSTVTNCNIINYFTGISLGDHSTLSNVLVLNVSTGIDAQGVSSSLVNVDVRNARYYDVYSKDSFISSSNVDADIFEVVDDRQKVQVAADPQNYSFSTPKVLLRGRADRILLDRLNISFEDYSNAKVNFNATAHKTDTYTEYEIFVVAYDDVENLSVVVFFPDSFSQFQFISGSAPREYPRMIRFSDIDLLENESSVLSFKISSLVPSQEIALPVVIPYSPKLTSPDVARRVAIGFFALAAFLFVFTKKFFLKQPVTLKEQLSLFLGVIALWAVSYKFTIHILQLTKDVLMFGFVLSVSVYYFYYVFKHRREFEKL